MEGEVPQPVPVEEEDVPGKIASAFELGVFEVLFENRTSGL